MTISSLLGRGDAPVSRFQMAGQSAMGDTEVFHVDRGSYSHSHGGGGKGGGKGSQSALSALTLLAFLFFINLLQIVILSTTIFIFVWFIAFDLSSMGSLSDSYAIAGIDLRFFQAHKRLYYSKVKIPEREIELHTSCLKDSMTMNSSSMLMMMTAANRSARHTRSLEEDIETEAAQIDALPGPGVYWDSNVLIRQKGDLGNEEFSPDQSPSGNDHSHHTNDGEIKNSLWNESIGESSMGDVDYDDYQEKNTNNSLSKSSNSQTKEDVSSSGHTPKNKTKFLHKEWPTQEESPSAKLNGVVNSVSIGSASTQGTNNLLHEELELPEQEESNQQDSSNVKSKGTENSASSGHKSTQNNNYFIRKELEFSKQEWPYQQESPQLLNIDEKEATSENSKDNGYYQYYSNPELIDSDWDYYLENDKFDDFVRRDFSTSNPSADGFINDRYETGDSEDGSFATSVGEYLSTIVTSVSSPVMERLQISVNIAQCPELVVCEVHRLGSTWGTPGLLLASGFSEVILWMYGNDDDQRKLIVEAAATGKKRHSCSVQMQQCGDKSRDRSALPLMATLLEHLV